MRLQRTATSIGVILLVVACSSDSVDPTVDPGNPTPPDDPNPEGVLLPGADADNALAATYKLRPSPAPTTEVRDGLLTTRLIGVLNPDATVGEVNDILLENDVRIVSMTARNVLLTLKTPPLASEAAARQLGEELEATGAFLFAFPAREVHAGPVTDFEGGGGSRLPEAGEGMIEHLVPMRMPAAWNVSKYATDFPHKVSVIVPDYYVSDDDHAELDAQSFVGPGTYFPDADTNGDYDGNHGTHVSGIIGANFDATEPTGTNPAPSPLLDIRSLTIGGMGYPDVFQAVVDELPSTGTVIMNTSLGLPESFTDVSRLERALFALGWRIVVSPHYGQLFHATAAGNEGDIAGDIGEARFGSPFASARLWGDVRGMVEGDTLSSADSLKLETAWLSVLTNFPGAAAPASNTLVVGSSDLAGSETSFSNRNSEVRVVGEDVTAPCASPDSDCNAQLVATLSGTSMATPAVAGLAAYLVNLDPTLDPQDLVQIIRHAYDNAQTPGVVDAYIAVLGLDSSIFSAPRRRVLLDVAGFTPESPPNGIFDENDIEAFLTFFELYETKDGFEDFSRYDLNGNGYTGTDFPAKFDLDIDAEPAFSTVSQQIQGQPVEFNENAATDLDILCYYAFSVLYEGDLSDRDDLLADCVPVDCPKFGAGGRVSVGELPDCTENFYSAGNGESLSYDVDRDCEVDGLSFSHRSTVHTDGNRGTIVLSSFRAGTESTTFYQSIAAGNINTVDRVTIQAPGLEGTEGTFQINLVTEGSMFANGCTNEGTATTMITIRSTINQQSALGAGSNQIRLAGCPHGTWEGPDTRTSGVITFTYGEPFDLTFRVDAQARVHGARVNDASSGTNLTVRWGGIFGLPPEATVSSCSGKDWLNPAP